MKFYTIRNKEGKHLLLDSRFVLWNEMPNAYFYLTEEHAKETIDYFYKKEQYNPLEDSAPLEICCFELSWEEVGKKAYGCDNL